MGEPHKYGGKSANFVFLFVSVPPPALEMTGDLDGEERRIGSSGNNLRTRLRNVTAGSTSDYMMRRGFSAALPLLSSEKLKSRGS
jgi:hypothetical protein